MFGEDLAQKESPESYKEVMIPQMGLVRFPDSMTDAEIEAAILKGLLEGDLPRRETSDNDFDHFQLFANCRPMNLVVEGLGDDASKVGLARESIQAAVESRLRSARLYSSEATNWLYINVNVGDRAFSTSLSYNKEVYDPASNQLRNAETWEIGGTGTHGEDAGYILSLVSQYMDSFLVDFLRVNEEACERRFALPEASQ